MPPCPTIVFLLRQALVQMGLELVAIAVSPECWDYKQASLRLTFLLSLVIAIMAESEEIVHLESRACSRESERHAS